MEARLSRLVEALASGGPLDTLVGQLKADEARKKELARELERLPGTSQATAIDPATVKADVRERAADVKELFGAHTPQARQMLRKLLDGKVLMEPSSSRKDDTATG